MLWLKPEQFHCVLRSGSGLLHCTPFFPDGGGRGRTLNNTVFHYSKCHLFTQAFHSAFNLNFISLSLLKGKGDATHSTDINASATYDTRHSKKIHRTPGNSKGCSRGKIKLVSLCTVDAKLVWDTAHTQSLTYQGHYLLFAKYSLFNNVL